MDTTDVLIIGGGLAGCALAAHLAAAGVATMLVERDGLGRGASGSNAGSLHFQLRRHDRVSPVRAQLIRGSLAEWRSVGTEFGARAGLRLAGGLMVAETAQELGRLPDKVAVERELGLASEIVGGQELARLAPALSEDVAGAVFCHDEGSVNPLLATGEFARAAASNGALIRTGCEVTAVRIDAAGLTLTTTSGRVKAARIVNAAGAWAGRLARMAGLELPLMGRVQMVSVTGREPPALAQLVQHIAAPLTLKQTMDGTFLIGGGWSGAVLADRTRPSWQSLAGNAALACRLIPRLRKATLLRSWTGTIAITPDRLPVAGESARLPCWHSLVVPRGAAGYTVSPYLARLLAESLARSGKGRLPAELSPDRWGHA
jgi:glycine/D-amino acid oxidase-like deaminating enzyme